MTDSSHIAERGSDPFTVVSTITGPCEGWRGREGPTGPCPDLRPQEQITGLCCIQVLSFSPTVAQQWINNSPNPGDVTFSRSQRVLATVTRLSSSASLLKQEEQTTLHYLSVECPYPLPSHWELNLESHTSLAKCSIFELYSQPTMGISCNTVRSHSRPTRIACLWQPIRVSF